MIRLIENNLKAELRKALLDAVIPCVMLIAITLVYKFKKSILIDIATQIKSVPEEFYILLGISPDTGIGNVNFFLFFFSMLFFLWFTWKTLSNTIYLIKETEHSGRLFRICNQLYNRTQLFCSLLFKALFRFFITYFTWTILLIILLLACSINQVQKKDVLDIWIRTTTIGFLIITTYISIIFFKYTKNTSGYPSETFCSFIIFFPWLISNLHKITGIIIWTAHYLKKDISGFNLNIVSSALEKLYWISPVSWYNPFNQKSIKLFLIQILICITVSGVLFIYSNYRYKKKDFFLP